MRVVISVPITQPEDVPYLEQLMRSKDRLIFADYVVTAIYNGAPPSVSLED